MSGGDFKSTMAALNLGKWPEMWEARWTVTERLQEAPPPPATIAAECIDVGMSAETVEAIAAAAGLLHSNQALQRLFRHCWHEMFLDRCSRETAMAWPAIPSMPMFYGLVLAAGMGKVRARNRMRGIPDNITDETLADLGLWIEHHRKNKGVWGFSEMCWLWHHFQNRLFTMGRLQFLLDTFHHDFHAYRNVADGRSVIFAPAAALVKRDGQFDGAAGINDPQAFTTVFRIEDDRIEGNPVRADGRIERETVSLQCQEWRKVLGGGSTAISVHIPATGPLDHAACIQSLERAAHFFPRYFPDYPIKAFFSVSWLYDNHFPGLLPPFSNIVQFQRMFHLFPIPNANDNQMWERVFGGKPIDLAGAPADTSLRRVIIAHVRAGGHFHTGGALILAGAAGRDSTKA